MPASPGPSHPAWDLAFTAFSWVPLHARHVVAAEGFTDFAARSRRLRRFLREYGWTATEAEFLEVVRARVQAHADGVRSNAAAGNEVFGRLLSRGLPTTSTRLWPSSASSRGYISVASR